MKDQDIKTKLRQLDLVDLETQWSKDELWDAVELKVSGGTESRHFSIRQWQALPWAAMILFALGIYWWSSNETLPKVEVVEIVVNSAESDAIENDESLQEGKNFILQVCQKELDVCASPSFQVLYTELTRIEEEKQMLAEAVKQYGADEIATRALIQLENAESTLTSQLISMIVI